MAPPPRYAYNEERQLIRVQLPSAKAIVNTYSSDRLIHTTTPEWTTGYTYACGDKVDTITRDSEVLDFGYDGDLVTSIDQGGTLAGSLAFTYNNAFQLASFSYAGHTENLGYDDDGLLTSSGDFAISRNADNGLTEVVSNDTFTLTRNFNGYGEVDAVAVDVAGASMYGYDLARFTGGRIKRKTETVGRVSRQFAYTYDNLGRLRTVTRDGSLVEEYRYDHNGNRTFQMNSDLGIAGRTFSHSLEDHTVKADSITYEFDLDDNIAARIEDIEATEYVYSTTGELMRVTLPASTVISHVHDPLGRRIVKKINGVIVEKYLWSGRTTLIAVYEGNPEEIPF